MILTETIKQMLEQPLQKMHLVVDDVRYEKEGSNFFLRVIIDREGVVDLDTCVEATRIINEILDREDPIQDAYILDVSTKEKGGL